MHRYLLTLLAILPGLVSFSQNPKTVSSSEILLQVKKLGVLGSVLYIAAHPDDENTRLLAYLANEKLYRTGYLSLTRGDGGQNLIGDEQGVDLGLIRTQELLAARRIDGAEQYFSRAYDFGYSKSSKEALETWGHQKILSDAVWVIRNFKPDVIITRFPEDGRAGHGHHAASAIIAREAFEAAGDPTKFPEQLSGGVSVHQAKRLLWNTFNFGNTNTQSEDQFKLDVGMYNPLLGKGYGEISAVSRSQHKSQGFGVPAQRGSALEYFSTIRGDQPVKDLMDGVDVTWARSNNRHLADSVEKIIRNYDVQHPERSVPALIALQKKLNEANPGNNSKQQQQDTWLPRKAEEVTKIIEQVGGLFMEVTATNQLNVIGDSIKLNMVFNNRRGIDIAEVMVTVFGNHYTFRDIKVNENKTQSVTIAVSDTVQASQPYWLEKGLDERRGSFDVTTQSLIGVPERYEHVAAFQVKIGSDVYHFYKPILYKYTDPVKGELYQPIQVVNPVFINSRQNLVIFKNGDKGSKQDIAFTLQFNKSINDRAKFSYNYNGYSPMVFDSMVHTSKGETRHVNIILNSDSLKNDSKVFLGSRFSSKAFKEDQHLSLASIKYPHIPDIFYNYTDGVTVLKMDLKTVGKSIGYIPGAGDRVPEALQQMGYRVTMLNQTDITTMNLKQFDAIVTGVRVYNTNEWMNNVYDELMAYVKEGGVLVTQYNTSNQIGPVKAKISPYPFTINRGRVTDEMAKVKFLLPNHPALNYPNKITEKDFEDWIQERSIYNAEKMDASYQLILGMSDPDEEQQNGSLIVANYGKGKFVYTGLVFFRQLPAGVPGAYRLFANLVAPPVK